MLQTHERFFALARALIIQPALNPEPASHFLIRSGEGSRRAGRLGVAVSNPGGNEAQTEGLVSYRKLPGLEATSAVTHSEDET